ncbi:MAG TPA: NADH-ubiquinone oxidoreductase-F iron-sulfur binding region domain-containing protein [Candidatus Saccharimonadales bacterium]|nr:NADH-ubiquinone oxidoreductase-F iron-sulfur binding region domain-containing protein [Candidatus Saccharimonadales bacterium]
MSIALLAGPPGTDGMESRAAHQHRLGALPPAPYALIDSIERCNLRGKGGAGFPVATKWRSVASQSGGTPVVLANGGEGEPLSRKDRMLMEQRPHLIIDGAVLAASAVGADEIVLYVGADHVGAIQAMHRAVTERPASERARLRLVSAPVRYVSGEETAAVHFINAGIALPTSIPPRPFERGVDGRPTLVQNVETLANVALIARFGDEWFRSLGIGNASGTTLVTVGGAVPQTMLIEIPQGMALAEAVNAAGGITSDSEAVLLGGYFGGWVESTTAWGLPLDADSLRQLGYSLGCGVIAVLPSGRCGVVETARILAYLAHESARQCGPCTFGLRAISATAGRVAGLASAPGDLEHMQRWAGLLAGRGACRHPDGAAGLLASSLRVFAREFSLHGHDRRCSVLSARAAAS